MSRALLFARNFFKHPKNLGSIIPSSRFLIKRVLREIDFSTATTFVEFGPGVGDFTCEILNRMRPDAVLVAFETNDEFVRFLRQSIQDPRFYVEHQSAAEVKNVLQKLGRERADYVLSGIPFSTIPDPERGNILSATHTVLHPGGSFVVYQFSRAVLPHLQRIFPQVRRDFEPLNILPAQLFYCQT